jgi:hypothetical protein
MEKINFYVYVLSMLEIGIPYEVILEMDEEESIYLRATHIAIQEMRNKQ